MSNSPLVSQICRADLLTSLPVEYEKDAHAASVISRFCFNRLPVFDHRFRLIIAAMFFASMLCTSGCVSISEKGLTIAFSRPDEEPLESKITSEDSSDLNNQAETEDVVPEKKEQPQEKEPRPINSGSPLHRKLNIDHWRAMPIWPKPTSGVEAVSSIQAAPLFRWQHQGFIHLPADSSENQSKKEAGATDDPLVTTDQKPEKQPWDVDLLPDAEQQKIIPQVVTELLQLAERDDLTGWNAIILIAQQSPELLTPTHLSRLKKLALEKIEHDAEPLSHSMQAAAAEAWCYALSMQTGKSSEKFAEAGRALQNENISDAVRVELMRGIARSIKPRLIPTLNRQLAESELQQGQVSSLTLAALDACICYAVHHPQTVSENQTEELQAVITFDPESLDPLKIWPENIWDVRWHQDYQAVNRFGMWLALTKHPIAQGYLVRRLNHLEHSVQYHAIRNLGLLHSETALEKLRDIVETRPGTSRAVGLLAIGIRDEKLIYHHLNDDSAIVRLAIAHFAGQHVSTGSAKVLQELTQDEDLKIQQAAVQAVAGWTDEKAFPVLSSAFISGGVPTRNMARKRLEQRFDIVMTAIQDDETDREQILETLSRKFQLVSHVNSTLFEEASHKTPGEKPGQEQIRIQLQKLLDEITQTPTTSFKQSRFSREVTSLIKQSPKAFDDVLNEQGMKQLEQILKQLKAFGIPEAQNIVQLNDEQLQHRRQAARLLAEQANSHTLANWELRIIAERLKQEQDLHICRDLMLTIDHDTTQEARVVAQNGLIHTWPDVRILGCQYVQKQRVPQLAAFLLPLLQERNDAVQQAAILACGYCQNPLVIDGFGERAGSQQTGLRSLLGKVNRETELLVIAGLARLGDEQGRQELLKLSYSSDTPTRRQVVRIMGELQDQKLVEHLIRIGWTEPAPDVRIAVLDALQQTVPIKQQPKIIATETTQQQMQIWSEWFDAQ